MYCAYTLTRPTHSHLLHRQAYVYVAILGVVLPLLLGFAWALLLYFFAGVIIYALLALLIACMLALTIWLASKTGWFDTMSKARPVWPGCQRRPSG